MEYLNDEHLSWLTAPQQIHLERALDFFISVTRGLESQHYGSTDALVYERRYSNN
jgi:hypothetical protein